MKYSPYPVTVPQDELVEELTLLCQTQPDGIPLLLSALEHGEVQGSTVKGCAYFHIADRNVSRAIDILGPMQTRLVGGVGCTPLELAVVRIEEGDTLDIPEVRALYCLIEEVRDTQEEGESRA